MESSRMTSVASPTQRFRYEKVQEKAISSTGEIITRDYSHDGSDQASILRGQHSPWRPFFLRRTVLASFIVLFLLIIVALEVLIVVSNRSYGIATGQSHLHYLWTFGPTFFLTVVAAFWSRTEYQSKLVTPWERLSQPGLPASRTVLLDYVSQIQITALISSLSNSDYLVFITTAVSLILKVLIILSAGLISLAWTPVTNSAYPMTLQNEFVDTENNLTMTGNLPYYMLGGLQAQNFTLPDGLSSNYAYQSMETLQLDAARTELTVDGLINSLDCEHVDFFNVTGSMPPSPQTGTQTLNVTMKSSDCNVKLATMMGVAENAPPGNAEEITHLTFFTRFQPIQCDGVQGSEGRRILAFFGTLNYTTDLTRYVQTYDGKFHPLIPTLINSTCLVCKPSYKINKVNVVKEGTKTISVRAVPGGKNRTLDSVTSWNMLDAQITTTVTVNTGPGAQGNGVSSHVGGVLIDTDPYMKLAFDLFTPPHIQAGDFVRGDAFQQLVTAMYQQTGAMIGKTALMRPAQIQATGSITYFQNRLLIRTWSGQLMAGLMAFCIIAMGVACFLVSPTNTLPHHPSEFLSYNFSATDENTGLLEELRYAGAVDDDTLAKHLRSSVFQSRVTHNEIMDLAQFAVVKTASQHVGGEEPAEESLPPSSKLSEPFALKFWVRILISVATAGLIVGLQISLHRSLHNQGLGDVGNDTYLHYAWTSVPTLVFALLAATFSHVDVKLRSLAPYMALRVPVTTETFTTLDLLDMTIPGAVYKEWRQKKFWAVAITVCAIISSLFTTFSASLFQEASFPSTTTMQIRANQSLDWRAKDSLATDQRAVAQSALIMNANYSYPRFTYEDLAFPEFLLVTNLSQSSGFNASTVSISARVPAVRVKTHCRLYDQSQISWSVKKSQVDLSDVNAKYLWGLVEGEESCADKTHGGEWFYNFQIPIYPNATYFGLSGESRSRFAVQGCSNNIYAWGELDIKNNPDQPVKSVAALGCNLTYEALDVDVDFLGTELDFNPQNPPRPREDSVRNTTVWHSNVAAVYFEMTKLMVYPELLDEFFSSLVYSRWAIPIKDLGNASASERIAEAIRFQNGIMQAQIFASARAPANTTNTTLSGHFGPEDNDAQPRYGATVTNAQARRRVVQDELSTHILTAMLALALCFYIVEWLIGPRADVLPRSQISIASVAALMGSGNLPTHLPSGAQWMSPERLESKLAGPETKFWMGWGCCERRRGSRGR